MIDFGIDKLAIIGAVALIVIGPERLPKVARTVGVLLGKAQRYVSQVQSEVNRSMGLEELKKMKTGIEEAARDVEHAVGDHINEARNDIYADPSADNYANHEPTPYYAYAPPVRKNWRLKRGAVPQWYKARSGVRTKAQSGAARVAR